MFKETPTTTNEIETVIGPSVKVEGDFVTEGNIIVEGTVCGSIKTSKNLKIGPQAKIFANLSAANALVAGEVQGNINISGKMELTSSAKIFGDIKVGSLNMAAGAILNGKCQMPENKEKTTRPEFSKQDKMELKNESPAGAAASKQPKVKKVQ